MSNLSVNSAKTPVPAPQAAQAQAAPQAAKPTPEQLRDPEHLVKPLARPDQSQAKAQAAGKAVQSVALVDTPAQPSDEDIVWATQLKEKAEQGYKPTETEANRFNNIVKALQAQAAQQPQAAAGQAAQASPTGVSPEELAWAQALETKVNGGYSPKPEEVARYQQIFQAVQASQAAQAPPAAPGGAPAPVGPAAQTARGSQAAPAEPVNVKAKFQELDELMAKKQYIVFGSPAEPEKVRQTAVQIWLDGKDEDKLELAKKLVSNGQSEILGRVLSHQETNEIETAQLMSQKDFPIAKFMSDLDDSHAFLVLKSLAGVAATGEKSSAKVIEQTVAAYDKIWDREAPFKQLKADLQATKQWEKLPADLRTKIDTLLK